MKTKIRLKQLHNFTDKFGKFSCIWVVSSWLFSTDPNSFLCFFSGHSLCSRQSPCRAFSHLAESSTRTNPDNWHSSTSFLSRNQPSTPLTSKGPGIQISLSAELGFWRMQTDFRCLKRGSGTADPAGGETSLKGCTVACPPWSWVTTRWGSARSPCNRRRRCTVVGPPRSSSVTRRPRSRDPCPSCARFHAPAPSIQRQAFSDAYIRVQHNGSW